MHILRIVLGASVAFACFTSISSCNTRTRVFLGSQPLPDRQSLPFWWGSCPPLPSESPHPKGWSRGSLHPQEFRPPVPAAAVCGARVAVARGLCTGSPPLQGGGIRLSACHSLWRRAPRWPEKRPRGGTRLPPVPTAAFPAPPCGLHASRCGRPCASYDVARRAPSFLLCAAGSRTPSGSSHPKWLLFWALPGPWGKWGRHGEKRSSSPGDSGARWGGAQRLRSHLLCLSAVHLSGNLHFSSLSFLWGVVRWQSVVPLTQGQADRKPSPQGILLRVFYRWGVCVTGRCVRVCTRVHACARVCGQKWRMWLIRLLRVPVAEFS